MRRSTRRFAALAALIATIAPAAAEAACPEAAPGVTLCEPSGAALMPSVTGLAFFPQGDGIGPFLGGGAELILYTWANDAATFGPGRGKIRVDAAGLASTRSRPMLLMFRGGATVSFEQSPGRTWLIPYFGGHLGGLHGGGLDGRGFIDGATGVYLLYTKNLILDAEGSYLFPFSGGDELAGVKTHLVLSVSLW